MPLAVGSANLKRKYAKDKLLQNARKGEQYFRKVDYDQSKDYVFAPGNFYSWLNSDWFRLRADATRQTSDDR